MTHSLLASRRFAPLFWRQFFAAFNDNFLKNALVLLILAHAAEGGASLVTLAGAAFIAPFFLLSAIGGEFADKYDKARVVRWLSLAEIAVAALSATGFLFANIPTLFGALILFGVTGALFGPVKYGILPDHLTREELPAGNALVESATFFAILSGTVAGGMALHVGDGAILAAGVMGVAALALGAAWLIPPTGRADPDLAIDANVFRSTFKLLRHLRGQIALRRLAVVTSLFWLFGSDRHVAHSLAHHPDAAWRGDPRQHSSGAVRRRHRHRIGARRLPAQGQDRAAADCRRRGARRFCVRGPRPRAAPFGRASRSDGAVAAGLFRSAARLARRDRSFTARGRRRADDRSVLRRHSGAERASAARPHHRRRECAERRLHGARRRRGCGSAELGRLFRGAADWPGRRRARRVDLDRQRRSSRRLCRICSRSTFAPSTVSR